MSARSTNTGPTNTGPTNTGPTDTGSTNAGLYADTVAVLERYRPPDQSQDSIRQAMLAFLAARPDATRRSCVPGHITASALVVDTSRRATLLTLHPRVGSWVQLGGHLEDDASVADAALREATEESGIAGLRIDPEPVQVDVHAVTCSLGVPTRHLDVRYLIRAPHGAEPVISSESLDLRWFGLENLPQPLAAGVEDLIRYGRARLDGGS